MEKQTHLLILPMYYPERDSSPHRGYMFYEQAMQLVQASCKVGLVFAEQRPLRNFTWHRFREESHFQLTQENNGSFTTLRMHAWNTKLSTQLGGFIWCLLTLIAVSSYIRRHGKPDIIHAHFGMWAGYAAWLIKKIYHIKYVITEHASSINTGNVSASQAKVLKRAYKNAARVICVGTRLANNIQPYIDTTDKIIVIPNFVDTSTFHLSKHVTQKEKQFVFISVGNLSKRKGFDDLIQAFHHSFVNQPHVSLLLVGDGEERESLAELIRTLHLEQQITLTGSLSREQLANRLATADAFVLASYGETFGIVFIEAMATGLPAIGTICGGPEDIITPETGLLLHPGEIHVLAQKMQELYTHYESFDKEAIRRYVVGRFDFELASHHLKEIYLKALNG